MAATKTEAGSAVFEEVYQNVRKAAEANIKMQQEAFRQWTSLWPGIPTPQSAWVDQVKQFRKQWIDTVSELAHKHRDTIDKQYEAAISSLDAALRVAEASNPEEFRRRSEQLCRKTLDCMKEMSETQLQEFQDTLTKCTELVTKVGK